MSNLDTDIRNIYIYKASNDSLLVYQSDNHSITVLDERIPFYEDMVLKTEARASYGSQHTVNNGTRTAAPVYGIAGILNIKTRDWASRSNILITYKTENLAAPISSRNLDKSARFLISKGIIPRPLGRKAGGVGDMFPHRYVI